MQVLTKTDPDFELVDGGPITAHELTYKVGLCDVPGCQLPRHMRVNWLRPNRTLRMNYGKVWVSKGLCKKHFRKLVKTVGAIPPSSAARGKACPGHRAAGVTGPDGGN